jgi:hypothetical protein
MRSSIFLVATALGVSMAAPLDYGNPPVQRDTEVDLSGVDFGVKRDTEVDLSGVDFGVKKRDTEVDLSGVDFGVKRDTEVDLSGVDFGVKRDTEVDLSGVDFGVKRDTEVDLSGVDFGVKKRDTEVDLSGVDFGVKRSQPIPDLADVTVKVPSPGIDLPLPETNIGQATGLGDITKPITNSIPANVKVDALNKRTDSQPIPDLADVTVKVPSHGIDLPLPETNIGEVTGLGKVTKPITNSLPVNLKVDALNKRTDSQPIPDLADVTVKVPSPGIDLPLPETNIGEVTGLGKVTKPITNSLPVNLKVDALN